MNLSPPPLAGKVGRAPTRALVGEREGAGNRTIYSKHLNLKDQATQEKPSPGLTPDLSQRER
ncbi:MAG: hypothetical protein Aurels2KO_14010 [Aureliella sp.]